jgi:hypothetical protein
VTQVDDARSADPPHYPEATAYAGAVDCYWLIADAPGVPAVAQTDWQKLALQIRDDLSAGPNALSHEIKLPAYKPFIAAMRADVEWAQFPVVPDSPKLPTPHQLLDMLMAKRSRFDNDTHIKNEGNLYMSASEVECAELDHWSNRLDAWLDEVQLRAANELNWSGEKSSRDTAMMERLIAPPEMPNALTAKTPAMTESAAPPNYVSNQSELASAKAQSRWLNRIGWLSAIAVLTAMVIACAKIVVAWPWLAIPIALIIVLIGKVKGKWRNEGRLRE